MFCGLDVKSPKIDCRWNSAALCVRLLPRRACPNQVSKTVAGPKDHSSRQSATNGLSGVDTAARYRRSAAEPSIGRRLAMTSRVMATTRFSTMAINCLKQGKTRMGLTYSDHGPCSLKRRRPSSETPTKQAGVQNLN